MNSVTPKLIVCAVRGGPESRSTVSRAIDLALEHQAHLTFLHILDAEFLEYATIGPLSLVYAEMVEMGTFAMLILCDRARRRGLECVDYQVLEGNIRKQLLKYAIDTHAEIIVMGKPTRSPGRNVFKPEEFLEFTNEMERDGKLTILQVTPSTEENS
jgi:nucleotide-binding universal stress UspA family protein